MSTRTKITENAIEQTALEWLDDLDCEIRHRSKAPAGIVNRLAGQIDGGEL